MARNRQLLFLALLTTCRAQMPGLESGMMPAGGMGGQDDAPETHNAEELTAVTFEERRMEYELLLVYFRDTQNQQEREMDKEIELAATELALDMEAAVHIGKIDLVQSANASKYTGVTDGPTIEVWRRGKKLRLGPQGGDARSVVNFVRYLSAPVSTKLNSSSALNSWLREQESTVILGIFADASRPSHNVWIKMAESLRPPYRFAEASVEDAQGAKLFASTASSDPLDTSKNQYAVVLPHRWVGKDEVGYHLASDFKSMATFVEAHSLSKVYPLTSTSHKRWRLGGRHALVSLCLDYERMGKLFKYVVNRLHKLLAAEPELTESFAFTITDTKYAKHASAEFGIDASRDFAVTVVNWTSGNLFATEELANASSADSFSPLPLVPWLERIRSGLEPPFVKTEPPPEKQAKGAGEVYTAVATNFAEVVEEEGYDALIVMYANKAPAVSMGGIHGLANLLSPLKGVRVVQINATANMLNGSRYRPRMRPQGDDSKAFLAAATANGKEKPVVFDERGKGQGRDLDFVELAEFVLKHANTSVAAADAEDAKRVRLAVKKLRRDKEKAAAEQFPGLVPEPKKKKRKKGKGKKAKEEL